MKTARIRPSSESQRRGLAPVELVLALPVWMLLASAMVTVGNLGAWKIRGHLAVREAAARSQWLRTRASDANPVEWNRSSAILRSLPAPFLQNNPLAGHSVIAGPQISHPGTGISLPVNGEVMESGSDAVAGEAFLNEPPAVWRRSGVRNRFAREFPVLSNETGQWQAEAGTLLRSRRLWALPPLE